MSRLLTRREFPPLLLAILLIAYALRVFSLGDFALSWDEGYSTWIMRLPLATLLETTARDVHPPVYYLLLRGFTLAAGEGEFIGRYLSVLLGLITVALVYRLGHTVGGRWTGVAAAALTAIARANLTIAQDMRMHMLAMLFVTLLLWAALMVMRQPNRTRWIVLYALAALGTLFTFYLAGMSLIVTNAAFAVWWWRCGRPSRPLIRWIAAHALIVGLFLPWGLYTYSQLLRGPSPEGMLSPLIYVQFYLVTLTMGFPTFDTAYVPFYLAVLIAVAAGVIVLLRTARRRVELSAPLALLLAGVIVPLAVVLVATIPFHSLARPVAARYFLSLSGAFYVLAAWAVVTLAQRRRWAGALAAVTVFGVALYGLLPEFERDVRRDIFVSVADTLTAHRQPEDALVLNNDRTWPQLAARYTDSRFDIPFANPISDAVAEELLADLWADSEAVWLITTPESLVTDPQQSFARWLDTRAVDSRAWTFNEYQLAVYARTESRAATLDALADGFALPPAGVTRPPLDGLAAVHLPLTRYQAGDAVHVALYWETPPASPWQATLTGGTAPQSLTFDAPAPAPDGLTRQVIRVPLTLDMPTGAYTLTVDGVPLAAFTLALNPLDGRSNPASTGQPLDWMFGDSIHLLGYELSSARVRPGEHLTVVLFWRADAPIDQRYKINTFVLGDFNPARGNPLWGGQDSEPFNWEIPTTAWPVGEVLIDSYTFRVDENAPDGTYQIGVVMYGLIGGERLPITAADGTALGDLGTVTTLEIRR